MGATPFQNFATGTSAKAAFNGVTDQALYDYGHAGYTGTIAEKHNFVHVGTVKTKKEAFELANRLDEENDPRCTDKWGPCGCITIEEGGYLFFGWASV